VKAVRAFDPRAIAPPRGGAPFEPPEGFSAAPLDLEIGCGVGWHPIRYASLHPDRYLIAIERTREKFGKFAGRMARHPNVRNLLPVNADAVAWVTHCLRPERLSRCFLLYPNPYPKTASQRWFRMPFMARLLECLAPDGEIVLATNIESYSEEAREYATGPWGLRLASARVLGREDLPAARTHFEKKYLTRGERCFESVFVKPGHCQASSLGLRSLARSLKS
jgi:tRNA G46 methylase TrmB